MQEFIINKFLTLRLEYGKTNIYIKGKYFRQCKYILIEIPVEKVSEIDEMKPIDEIIEELNHSLENHEITNGKITAEDEFWGHCSNLQVWYEYNYDTRLLHRNLAFPLLKELAKVGDPIAKMKFKKEIISRAKKGNEKTYKYLAEEGYLEYLSIDERLSLVLVDEEIDNLIDLSEELSTPITDLVYYIDKIHNKRITELDLSKRNLSEIPKSVFNFKYLKILNLRLNKIKIIPNEITKLKNLEELRLSSNNIEIIPNSIGELKFLRNIYLDYNKLKKIPKTLGNLDKLEKLFIGNNLISSLPTSLCDLQKLKKLSLLNNNLNDLPKSFSKLTSLEYIDLRNNKLEIIPEQIINLPSLKKLNITSKNLEKNEVIKKKLKKKGINSDLEGLIRDLQ